MSASDVTGHRLQCLANARLLLRSAPSPETTRALPSSDTSATLVAAASPGRRSTTTGTTTSFSELDVVVFGDATSNNYTAAVMMGLTPAIEGAPSPSPEVAIRKLLLATCELLKGYMPKVGSHQRFIHGGGVFDEDVISPELIEASKRSS